MPSIRLGTGDLAKYPFLNEAGAYLRESGFDWSEFDRSELSDPLSKAVERVYVAVQGGVYKHLDKYEVEVLSFLISLLLVKSIGIDSLTRKYALAEARRAEDFLSTDMKRSNEEQRQLLMQKIFFDLFNLNMTYDSLTNMYRVDIESYLIHSSHFHEQEWKLVNRPLSDGKVYLDADEAVRLTRSQLSQVILERIKSMEIPSLPDSIRSAAEEMRNKLAPHFEHRQLVIHEYPPCVKHSIETLNNGENLSHSARVMLATYLLAAGKSVEEIVSVFKSAPDFNEKITRYQIEHLSGSKGSRVKYSVPSCDKLRTQSLCYATAACDGIINPVQFGRRRQS